MLRLLILCGLGWLAMRLIRGQSGPRITALIPSPERMRHQAADGELARRKKRSAAS